MGGRTVTGGWLDEAANLDSLLDRLEIAYTIPSKPAGGGWHYPTVKFYENQSHIIRGEN